MPNWKFDDGGRTKAGHKGFAGDCVCRAIAIATGISYRDVYDAINREAQTEKLTKRREKRSSARTGVHKPTHSPLLGLAWVDLGANHAHRLRVHGPLARRGTTIRPLDCVGFASPSCGG